MANDLAAAAAAPGAASGSGSGLAGSGAVAATGTGSAGAASGTDAAAAKTGAPGAVALGAASGSGSGSAGSGAVAATGTGSAGAAIGADAAAAPGALTDAPGAGMVGYSFIIRRAEDGDAQSIRDILESSFSEYIKQSGIGVPLGSMVDSIDSIRRDIANIDVFIACMDGMPVGTVRVEVLGGGEAILTKLGVMTGYGNIGIGKSLMNLVDKVIAARHVRTLKLYTAARNASLMRFYYGRGFYADSTTKDRGYIRVLMKKDYAC
ncbi:MAG: GNAT family N-acetyltransferase [Clostridiales bacterium]|jgi:predicted N-acetyltransferase YhbS|nr:GNAT family N-acetyltransferase [Clostridiales bacterium]